MYVCMYSTLNLVRKKEKNTMKNTLSLHCGYVNEMCKKHQKYYLLM